MINSTFSIRAAVILAGLTSGFSLPQSVRADWNHDEAMKRQASFEVKDASMEDYFLDVARAYRVNLFLDSTRVPQDGPSISQRVENGLMWGSLAFFASRHGINGKQLGDGNTILLWQQADVAPLARELALSNEVKAPPPDAPDSRQLVFNQSQIQPLAIDFFRQQKGWNGQRPFKATANFAELPEELKARLALQTRGAVWDMTTNKASSQWFLDDFWKNARLLSLAGRDSSTGKVRQEIAVVGTLKRDENGVAHEQCVYVAAPGSPFNRLSTPLVKQTATTGTGFHRDAVLANSSLAAPYQPGVPENLALSTQAGLAPKVTLAVKRRPLAEVVKTLGEKGGIALAISPEIDDKNTLLTLSVEQMPLHEAMTALTQLVGLEWSRSAIGYVADRRRGTALETRLLQATRFTPTVLTSELGAMQSQKAQEAGELTAKIKLALGQEFLTRPEGAFFPICPTICKTNCGCGCKKVSPPILWTHKAFCANGWRL